MTDDRYQRAVDDLRGTSAPDQWQEITDRAADDGTVVALDDAAVPRHRRRAMVAVTAAAASVAALVGAVWLVQGDQPSAVLTDDPPPTVEPTDPEGEAVPAPFDEDAPDAAGEGDPVLEAACNAGSLVAASPPEGMSGQVQPPAVDDPRIPQELRSTVAGVYPGDTTTHVVFSLEGHPEIAYDESAASTRPGPFAGEDTLFAPYDDGWIAQVDVTTSEGAPCPFTFVGVGVNEADFTQFVNGLALSATPK